MSGLSAVLASPHGINCSEQLKREGEVINLGVKTLTKIKNKSSIFQKICNIAKLVFKGLISVFFYWVNPTPCALGFITGIFYEEETKRAIKKIKNIWTTQPWSTMLLGGVASFLSLPVTLAASSFLWAAHLGSILSREAKQEVQRRKENNELI